MEPHALLLELLASISDGPPIRIEGVSGVEFQDSAWFEYHQEGNGCCSSTWNSTLPHVHRKETQPSGEREEDGPV